MSTTLSASLAQAREIYNSLNEIEQKLMQTETAAKTATIAYADLYNVIQDVFMILKRAGLPDDAAAAITMMQRMIITLNSLRVALTAMNLAMAGSPSGILLAGFGLTMTFISMTDISGSYG